MYKRFKSLTRDLKVKALFLISVKCSITSLIINRNLNLSKKKKTLNQVKTSQIKDLTTFQLQQTKNQDK